MTWFSSEASLGDTGKESNPLGHLPLRGQRLLVGSWSPANKDTHHSLQDRHLTAVLSVLRRFAKSGSEGPLSRGVWSGEPTWVVFLGQLLQGSAALCCSQYDLQTTCLRGREGRRSDFYVCVSSKAENHGKLMDVPLSC